MTNNINTISASEGKKHFLQLIDEVNKHRKFFTITKRKMPIAQIIPLPQDKKELQETYFGSMKGIIKIKDDIVNTNDETDWGLNNE